MALAAGHMAWMGPMPGRMPSASAQEEQRLEQRPPTHLETDAFTVYARMWGFGYAFAHRTGRRAAPPLFAASVVVLVTARPHPLGAMRTAIPAWPRKRLVNMVAGDLNHP